MQHRLQLLKPVLGRRERCDVKTWVIISYEL
jgi:hypothetical protein